MCLFGCRNRQRRSCSRQWNTTGNTARRDSRSCTACGESRERRTWDSRCDNCRNDSDSCDCDD